MQDILTKGERIEMIEEIVGSQPWTEIYFQRRGGDQRVAKVANHDGSQTWYVDDTDELAIKGLLQAVQS